VFKNTGFDTFAEIRFNMKKLLPLFLLAFLLFTACQPGADFSPAKQIIEELRLKYAPDKRVALFAVDTSFTEMPLVLRGETNLPAAKAELIEKLSAAGIAFTDSLAVLPSPALSGQHFGVVSVSVCNIRSNPKHSAELATQALLGTSLRVWKQDGGFFLVQTPDDYFGWVDAGGFQLMDSVKYENWMQSQRAVVTQDYVFAFETPSENAPKVTDLLAGNILQTLESQAHFTQIQLPDGRSGFVKSAYLTPLGEWLDSHQPDADHILATAKEMMGRPYLWGGTSGKGMDCSGFTKMAFYLNGIQLPRDASQQVHTGEAVDTDTTFQNLQPGDLLFFGRKATPEQKEKITHVAIYLGDGKIIHASDMVEVESLRRGDPTFAEHRLTSFVRSKRMIGSEGKNGVVRLKDSAFYKVTQNALQD
jgi:gamma-D-glutamyl-L-lysine dipeptidyl-peptidase